jgi:uncharacterized protein (DUF2132 family)
MNTIFISIASYRDPELLSTLHDCINNADYPENLTFGIAWQHNIEDKWDNLDEFKNDPRFKIIDINYKDSKGTCWARNKIQELWNNETYYLQLDSHHRFTKGWDTTLIEMLEQLKITNPKPLLTAYLPGFFPDNDPAGRVNECWNLEFDRYMPEGPIFIKPHTLENWEIHTSPIPTRFISAHFIFTLGKWVKEVKYDPYFYFHGEEPSLAARSYTYGYDLFQPYKPIIWHEYTRNGKVKQWDDDKEWTEKNKVSYSRYRALHGMGSIIEGTTTDLFEKYGWGTERTLEEYEKYAGVKFATKQVHRHTAEYKLLPVPQDDFEKNLLNRIKVCIDVWKGTLTETDYDTFAVAILDKERNDIFRQDMDKDEFDRLMMLDPQDQFIHIWREYDDNKQPAFWRVWPHSISKGWVERIENNIPYE